MKAADVEAALVVTGRPPPHFCLAVASVLPVLRELAKARVWWLRWGVNALIGALDEYRAKHCP